MWRFWLQESRDSGRSGEKKMKRIPKWGVIPLAMILAGAATNMAQSPFQHFPEIPASDNITIPSSQKFIMQLETGLHTSTTRKGDRVEFITAADIVVDDTVVISNKSRVKGTVTEAKRAGRLFGDAEIRLHLDEIQLADGNMVPLNAVITRAGFDPVSADKDEDPRVKGESGAGEDIGVIAEGGTQGAIIGVISGGGRGALIGSAAGAGIAAVGMLLKRGPDLDLPRYTMFEAQFNQDLEIPIHALPPPAPIPSSTVHSIRQEPPDVSESNEDWTPAPRPRLTRNRTAETAPEENIATDTSSVTSPEAPASGSEVKQPAATGEYSLSVKVRMVLVDAVVKDRSGRMIDNLKKEDFLVFEDGEQQPLTGFSRDELPLAIALVVDRSGSVSPYIAELRRIANSALQQLKPEDAVSLFSFANTVSRLEGLTTDRQKIANSLARIRTGGGTNIIDALFEATTYLARSAPDRRHAVILISDNRPTIEPKSTEGQTIRAAIDSETVVYSLETEGEAPPLTARLPSLLRGSGSVGKITRETGGEIIEVSDVGSFDSALAGVISRLRMRYSLAYRAPNPSQGAFHSIDVMLDDQLGEKDKDYFIHARRGYYATADKN